MKSKGNTRIVLRNLRDANGMFSEDALKLLALVTMFLDHVGAGLLKYFLVHTIPEGGAAWQYCGVSDSEDCGTSVLSHILLSFAAGLSAYKERGQVCPAAFPVCPFVGGAL